MTTSSPTSGLSPLVAGEDPHLLLEALRLVAAGLQSDEESGGYVLDVELDREQGGPLVRALMRIEVELLLDEADAPDAPRPAGARRVDALVLLARRTHAALEVLDPSS
jgi:hypothetical protein